MNFNEEKFSARIRPTWRHRPRVQNEGMHARDSDGAVTKNRSNGTSSLQH